MKEEVSADTGSFERGLAFMERMQGPQFAAAMREGASSDGIGGFAAQMAVRHTFGDIWSRDGLAPRDRSIVVMSILLAQGHMTEFRNHVRFGLRNGLTAKEIEEILYQAQPYAGWGAVSQGLAAAIEVLRETGEASDIKTAEERGLL